MTMTGGGSNPANDPHDYLGHAAAVGPLLDSGAGARKRTGYRDRAGHHLRWRGARLCTARGHDERQSAGQAVRNIDKEALVATLSDGDPANRAEISRTIVEQVLETRLAVLSHNAMEDPRFASRQSVQLSNLRSVLCVPLIVQARLLGIIYLDSRIKTGVFTERHLAMFSAFANQAAVAIENARLYDNLRRSMEERLKLQDALHAQETQRLALEEASRLKSDFIGFVAHELRNPLTTIRGTVQTILADKDHTLDEEIVREFHEAIEADSDRLLDMINEMLDVSRLEAGRPLTLAVKQVELRPMLEKLARRHKFYKFFTNQHQLTTEFGPDLPPTIEADEDKLNQVVSNLLSNAIKYSPDGGEVRVVAEKDGEDHVVLRVYDSGVGMSDEQRARLFRQYERIERDEIRKIPGTGLGLYLVKTWSSSTAAKSTPKPVPKAKAASSWSACRYDRSRQ